MTFHWTVSAATLLSISALGASPMAESGAELMGMWVIPVLTAAYGLYRTISARLQRN